VASLTITFDHGTLRLEGPVHELGDPRIRYDARASHHRAPAHRYGAILAAAVARGWSIDDRVAPELMPGPEPSRGPPLRIYQEQALTAFETFGARGVVALPTGAGKTHVACAALARCGSSAAILVPTRVLLDQWVSILGEHFGEVGRIGDGAHRVEPITVMTFESAYRQLDRIGHRFGMLVVDEAHHFGGGARSEALEMCVAPRRLGLTATPPQEGTEGRERLEDLVGPVVFHVAIADLVGKHLADLEIVRIHVGLTREERESYRADIAPYEALRFQLRRDSPRADWKAIFSTISRLPDGPEILSRMQRASALAAFPRQKRRVVSELLARHREDRTLVFTATAHDAYAVGRDALVPVITAETSREERAEILDAFRDGTVRVIVSARVLNEGVDVPEANVAIIAAGAQGAREYVQRIGRVLRPRENKLATVYELVTVDTVDEARTRAKRRRLAAPEPAVDHAW
jgi:superfamily II DNA or RNA helicase